MEKTGGTEGKERGKRRDWRKKRGDVMGEGEKKKKEGRTRVKEREAGAETETETESKMRA